MVSFIGVVKTGAGLAQDRSPLDLAYLEELMGVRFIPGTLNVALDSPIVLAGFTYRTQVTNTLLYLAPGKVNGIDAGIMKTPGTRRHPRLHEIEIYAPVHLRSTFDLSDGERVLVELDETYLVKLGLLTWLRWWSANSRPLSTLKKSVQRAYRSLREDAILNEKSRILG